MTRSCRRLLRLSLLAAALAAPALAQPRVSSSPALAWEAVLQGDKEHRLRWPVGVAAASSEEIVIADAFGSRLVIFHDDADRVGWKATRSVELPASPQALIFDGERYLLSLRNEPGLLALEPPDFRFRTVPLPEGTAAAALAAASGESFLVYDAARHRVLLLDGDGRLRDETPIEGHLTALTSAAGGGFLAAFANLAEVRHYSAAGEVTDVWPVPGIPPVPAWPRGLAAHPGGEVFVVDRHGGRILLVRRGDSTVYPGSRRGWEPGLLLFPSAIALLPGEHLAVADQGNGRVQIFRRIDENASQ